MKATPFDYVRPATLDAAFAALTENGVNIAAIAGGQSLLPMLNLRVAIVDLLVDIARLDELKEVTLTPDTLRIGALITHAAIEDRKLPDVTNGLMQRVAAGVSYRAIRHHGTIGGSMALADPAADWPGCLMALGATVRIANRSGVRIEPVEQFIRGQYETSLARGEIVLGIEVPRTPELRWGFAKVARKSGAFANSIAVAVARDRVVTMVLAAAAPRPLRMSKVGAQAATQSEGALREAIAEDLAGHLPDADAYQRRLHAATILHSLRELHGR
jgi:aerobic carbon-monoxide dehydrogenase medium subunit